MDKLQADARDWIANSEEFGALDRERAALMYATRPLMPAEVARVDQLLVLFVSTIEEAWLGGDVFGVRFYGSALANWRQGRTPTGRRVRFA